LASGCGGFAKEQDCLLNRAIMGKFGSFSWIPCSANQVAYQLAKLQAKHLTSFVGDCLSP